MGIIPEYAIAFVYEDASLDAAVERVRSRGVVVLYLYDGAGAYAFRVTEEGTELTTVHYDPATKVITFAEGGIVRFGVGPKHATAFASSAQTSAAGADMRDARACTLADRGLRHRRVPDLAEYPGRLFAPTGIRTGRHLGGDATKPKARSRAA